MDARDTVSVPGTESGIRQAADAADAWCHRHQVAAEARRRLLTALDEVLSNVVRHGFQGGRGRIDLTLVRDSDRVIAQIADDAAPFNPLLLPPPDVRAALDARQPGGLGIAIVRGLADAVHYERRADQNVLTLMWRAAPEDVGP